MNASSERTLHLTVHVVSTACMRRGCRPGCHACSAHMAGSVLFLSVTACVPHGTLVGVKLSEVREIGGVMHGLCTGPPVGGGGGSDRLRAQTRATFVAGGLGGGYIHAWPRPACPDSRTRVPQRMTATHHGLPCMHGTAVVVWRASRCLRPARWQPRAEERCCPLGRGRRLCGGSRSGTPPACSWQAQRREPRVGRQRGGRVRGAPVSATGRHLSAACMLHRPNAGGSEAGGAAGFVCPRWYRWLRSGMVGLCISDVGRTVKERRMVRFWNRV